MDVLIGLGGNVGDLRGAFARVLSDMEGFGVVTAVSGLYQSRPVGPPQPDYLNAALVLDCGCGIWELLRASQEVEVAAGRDRGTEQRWGPRPLDVDLLLVRSAVLKSPQLVLPHPRFHERAFALVPAADVAGEWVHPLLGETVAQLAERVLSQDPDAVERVMR